MQKLNIKEFKVVSKKVKKLRHEISEKQSQMRIAPIPQEMQKEEKRMKQELNRWSVIEESIHRQKSSIQWLKQGDANTVYFFASMKGKKTKSNHNATIGRWDY